MACFRTCAATRNCSILLYSFTFVALLGDYLFQKIIRLEVERGEVVKVIELRPHTWEGKGVLGCALEPTTS
eukprot:m.75199 g.75199  ORF g.75199 m.75199 type:complete len:71 (-) comp12438_c0_seq4:165-377(-)